MQLLWTVVCVALQKGQRLLDTRREPSGRLRQVNLLHLPIDSPTEESTLIRPEDSRQSVFFPLLFSFLFFFLTEPAAHHRRHMQTPIIQRDMMTTVWDYDQQKMRGAFLLTCPIAFSLFLSKWRWLLPRWCLDSRLQTAMAVTINRLRGHETERGYRSFKNISHPKQVTCDRKKS